MNRQLSSIPSTANIVNDPLGPVWTHGSPRRQSNLEVERLCLGLHPIQRCCKVDGNIESAKYQQILASQYIPNYKRGQIFQQDGAPCHNSGSTKFLRGKNIKVLQGWPAQSPDINIIEHIWGRMKEEAWRTKPKNLEELWDACKVAFHAIPDNFINKPYDSLPNRMATVLQAKGTRRRY